MHIRSYYTFKENERNNIKRNKFPRIFCCAYQLIVYNPMKIIDFLFKVSVETNKQRNINNTKNAYKIPTYFIVNRDWTEDIY
jgi:hypothetical protein